MPEIARFFGIIIRMFTEPAAQQRRRRLVEAWAAPSQDSTASLVRCLRDDA